MVKSISVRLIDIIAHRDNLKLICGDIRNAFLNAKTDERCYVRAGPEFGPREGSVALIVCALYGLVTSAERWRACFADFLRSLGFVPTRYDRGAYLRTIITNITT